MGRDNACPAPYSVAWAAPAACAWREKEGCGRPPGVVNAIPLLCSPTWKRVAALLVLNREGEPPAGLCGLAGGGGFNSGGDAPSFGCVGDAGAWRFPLGGGLGVVVTISFGSVGGVGWGVEFGCGQ